MHFRSLALCAICLAMAFSGCGSDDDTSPSGSPPESSPSDLVPLPEEETSPIDGTWATGPISREDIDSALEEHGLAKWIDRFNAVGIFTNGLSTMILDLKEGEWDLYVQPKGGSREEIDYDAEFVMKGNRVDKIHSTGATTYRWSITGDTLTLEWFKSTEPPYKGIPDEVFGTALYMTEDFTRQE